MDKQEVIGSIKNEEIFGAITDEDDAYNKGLDTALGYVEKLEVPKKAVLSKVEAEWLDGFKDMCWPHTFDMIHFIITNNFDNLFYYDRKNVRHALEEPNTDAGKANLKMRLIRSNGFIQGSYMSANKIPDRYLLCKVKSIRVLRYEIEVNIEEDYVLW